MTSPLAVVGLTWDGYDVQRSDLDVFLEITEGLDELPELRSSRHVIPFRHGQRPDMPYANGRPLVLTGLLSGPAGTERAGYRGYIDEVKQSFSPFRVEPGILAATLEDGTLRWISAMPLDLRPASIVPGASRVSIELLAHDPFWYGSNGSITLDSGLLMDTGLLMDGDAWVTITPTSAVYDHVFTTLGTADSTKVRVEIDGPSDATVVIGNLAIADTPGFAYPPLLAGQTLVVDSGLRTVTLNGANARGAMSIPPQNRHGEYFRVRPGSNTFHITGKPAKVRLFFPATYL